MIPSALTLEAILGNEQWRIQRFVVVHKTQRREKMTPRAPPIAMPRTVQAGEDTQDLACLHAT